MTHTLILTNSTYPDGKFKAQIENAGFNFIHAPVLSISHFDIDISRSLTPKILIVTSKHAIYAIGDYNLSKNIEVVCVGETVRDLLVDNGFSNIKSCFKNGCDLIKDIKDNARVYKDIVYLRGKDVQHDIKSVCRDLNLTLDEYIVYESVANSNIFDVINDFITLDQEVTFCVFSKKGADYLADNIKLSGLGSVVKRTNILCLSESMLSSLKQFQWRNSSCCTFPTRGDFLKQLSVIKKNWV